jgi:hypothetical protein
MWIRPRPRRRARLAAERLLSRAIELRDDATSILGTLRALKVAAELEGPASLQELLGRGIADHKLRLRVRCDALEQEFSRLTPVLDQTSHGPLAAALALLLFLLLGAFSVGWLASAFAD